MRKSATVQARRKRSPTRRVGIDARPSSVVNETYQTIIASIGQGKLKAGQRLTEAWLTAELGVSRGSVREAMHRLSSDGIIEFYPNRGAVVRRLTRQDLAEFFQIRTVLESFAARRAAERINEAGARDRVIAMVEEIERLQVAPSGETFPNHDTDLHNLILELSGNNLLHQEWRRMRQSRFRMNYLANSPPEQIGSSLQEHRKILLAVLDGDAAAASAAASDHVEMTNSRIQRLPQAVFQHLFNIFGDGA